ncbi:MAG: hypothetical protein M3396_11415 [Actinomycetota bacterium]|nr:hypothetical protein [Actinomycetota bacterium]MDQ3575849.1 hypothetical protein [Actinomycetota bacterium]
MEALLYLLPALGCGLMMVACMYLMGRGMRSHPQHPPTEVHRDRAELQEEVARLRAEGEGEQARG